MRPARALDAEAIASIGRVAFPPTYAAFLDPAVIATVVDQLYSTDAVSASLAASRTDPAARFLVAERGGAVIGFLDYDEFGPEPELHRIYLSPEAIGTGAGSALMNALHGDLPDRAGYVLLVAGENTRAVEFYRRHGLTVRESIDAIPYYRERMGVAIHPGAEPVAAHIMEWIRPVGGTRTAR